MMDILNTSTKILFNIVQVNVCPCYLLKSTVVCFKNHFNKSFTYTIYCLYFIGVLFIFMCPQMEGTLIDIFARVSSFWFFFPKLHGNVLLCSRVENYLHALQSQIVHEF